MVPMFFSPSTSTAGTASVKAGEAAAATVQSAATASDAAPDDRNGDHHGDHDTDDGGIFAVGFLHAFVPAREGLRRALDVVDSIRTHRECESALEDTFRPISVRLSWLRDREVSERERRGEN